MCEILQARCLHVVQPIVSKQSDGIGQGSNFKGQAYTWCLQFCPNYSLEVKGKANIHYICHGAMSVSDNCHSETSTTGSESLHCSEGIYSSVVFQTAVWGCTLAGGPLGVRMFDVTVTRCRRFLLRRSHLPVSIKHDIIDC